MEKQQGAQRTHGGRKREAKRQKHQGKTATQTTHKSTATQELEISSRSGDETQGQPPQPRQRCLQQHREPPRPKEMTLQTKRGRNSANPSLLAAPRTPTEDPMCVAVATHQTSEAASHKRPRTPTLATRRRTTSGDRRSPGTLGLHFFIFFYFAV